MTKSETASAAYCRRTDAKMSFRNGVLENVTVRITVLLMTAMTQSIGTRQRIKKSNAESPLVCVWLMFDIMEDTLRIFGVDIEIPEF